MEFLRFGSSIPGSYWGCCAVCIAQNFKVDPDAKASIELVCGDGGEPINGEFLGKTWKEVFESRIRIGTFSNRDMPNHGFLAILTASQVSGGYGAKWLKILKENGFEFIRSVSNSVYQGSGLLNGNKPTDGSLNYVFGLFRNIGTGAAVDPFEPPKAWTALDSVEGAVLDPSSFLSKEERAKLSLSRDNSHISNWNRIGSIKTYTRKQLEADGVPVWVAGRRSTKPQRLAEKENASVEKTKKVQAAPFKAPVAEF
jgi:hypothetical protein